MAPHATTGALSPAFSFLFSSLIIVFYNTDVNAMKVGNNLRLQSKV
jgi:hypothetical protein